MSHWDSLARYENAKARKLEARAQLGSFAQILDTIFDGLTSFVVQLFNSACNQLARIPEDMWVLMSFIFVIMFLMGLAFLAAGGAQFIKDWSMGR